MMNKRECLLLLAGMLIATTASAQGAYPARPVRLVLGMAPGTVVDVTARALSVKLSQRLGQPVLVENRPGAGGSIAANFVAKAEPDGYTLWYGTATNIHPLYLRNNAVVLGRDLQPVTNVLSTPYVFYTSARLPVKSLKELMAYAKSNPEKKLNFALQTPTFDLLMHVLKGRTGITYTTVPYTGGGPAAITALRSGESDFTLGGVPGYAQHLEAGTLRALFITTPQRSSLLPDVPTAAEAGIGEFVAASTVGVMAPMGTPAEVVRRINAELVAVLREPDVVAQLRSLGSEPAPSTPQAQQQAYETDMRMLGEAAKLANYQPQ